MNEITLIGFIGTIVLFLFILWDFMTKKNVNSLDKMFGGWKYHFFLLVLISFTFFLYFSSSMYSIGSNSSMVYNGQTYTVQNNDYLELVNFMPLITGSYILSFGLCIISILQGFQAFGRSRLSGLR